MKGPQGGQRSLKGRLLKQTKNTTGYYVIGLRKEGEVKQAKVHRLVAIAFLGQPPKDHVVCHGPKGKFCNGVANLSWGTMKQNLGPDRVRDGTDYRGEKSSSAKLNKMQVRVIRRLLESKSMNNKEIAAIFGVHPATISDIKRERRWQHL